MERGNKEKIIEMIKAIENKNSEMEPLQKTTLLPKIFQFLLIYLNISAHMSDTFFVKSFLSLQIFIFE